MSAKGHSRSMEWLVMQRHDGRLPERHRAVVEAHLSGCRECQDYLGTARSSSTWLKSAPAGAGLAPEFSEVWQGIAGRLPASTSPAPWRAAWQVWTRPFQWGWLAAGSLAVALLLLLVNPYGRLSLQSHEASVAFVEASDYPVIVMMPSKPGEMTVIWLFEPQAPPLPPPT